MHCRVTSLSRPCNKRSPPCGHRIVVTCGRSRTSAGGARPESPGWRTGGSESPLNLRAPGGMRRTESFRMSPPGALQLPHLLSEGTGPFERASAGDGGCPATIGGRSRIPGHHPDGIRRPRRVDGLSRACYSDTPVGTAPQGPPAAEGDSPARPEQSFGTPGINTGSTGACPVAP
jgi:hypothetical protein